MEGLTVMSLRYKCLVIDHDDTAVNSTATIHYPAYVDIMRTMRPGHTIISLEEFLTWNSDVGLTAYYKQELGMTDEEIEAEHQIWLRFATERAPEFYEGFLDLLDAHRARGGLIVVASHSDRELIERDYRLARAEELLPDVIFGWDADEKRRKPNPYPIEEIQRAFGLHAEEVLVVDDLKPGVLMAKAAGVNAAGAGWGHRVPEIEQYMRANCTRYFSAVDSLTDYVLSGK